MPGRSCSDPEARQINRRMAQEYIDLAQQVIEEEFPPFYADFSWTRSRQGAVVLRCEIKLEYNYNNAATRQGVSAAAAMRRWFWRGLARGG